MIIVRLRVGEVVRARGWLARDLAEHADIAVATARALCLGENERIDLPLIAKVARALNVRLLTLLEEVEVPDPVQENKEDQADIRMPERVVA